MKYPIAFRIFAVINLLLFFFFAVLTFISFSKSETLNSLIGYTQTFVTVWVLVASLAWMFASKSSFHFLYSLGLSLLALSVVWILAVMDIPHNEIPQYERGTFGGIFGILLIYPVFMFGAMFFGPIKAWTEKKFSGVHLGFFLGTFILISLLLTGIRYVNVSYKEYDVEQFSYGDFEDDMLHAGESRQYILRYPVMANGLTCAKPYDGLQYGYPEFVEFSFVSEMPYQYELANRLILPVKEVKDQLQILFPNNKIAAWELRPCNSEGQLISGGQTFYLGFMKPIQTYKMYDAYKLEVFDQEVYYTNYELDGEYYEEDGADYEPMAGYNGKTLNADTYSDMVCGFIDAFSTEYYPENFFDMENDKVEIGCGAGNEYEFGMYKSGFVYIEIALFNAIQNFQGFYMYDPATTVSTLTGMDLYLEDAEETRLQYFNLINPAVIRYARENMIPDPKAMFFQISYSDIYHKLFERFARMMVRSHHLVYGELDVDMETQQYIEASRNTEYFYGGYYLMEKYGSKQVALDGNIGYWSQDWEFIGFWLRRHVDGSEDEVWKTVVEVMQTFDSDWYESFQNGNEEISFDAGDESGD